MQNGHVRVYSEEEALVHLSGNVARRNYYKHVFSVLHTFCLKYLQRQIYFNVFTFNVFMTVNLNTVGLPFYAEKLNSMYIMA